MDSEASWHFRSGWKHLKVFAEAGVCS